MWTVLDEEGFLPQVDNQAKGYLGGLSTKRNFEKSWKFKVLAL